MKKISMLLIAFVAGIVFTTVISWKDNDVNIAFKKTISNAQHPGNSPVLAIRKLKLKGGVTPEAFESFATKVAVGEFGSLPGAKFYFGRGERGDDPDSYLAFIEFDSKTTRDFYAPVAEDNTKTPAETRKLIDTYFNNTILNSINSRK